MDNTNPPFPRHAICVAILEVMSAYPDLAGDADVLRELMAIAAHQSLKEPRRNREEARASLLLNCQKLRNNLEREKAQLEIWELSQRENALKVERARLEQIEAQIREKREELERTADPLRSSLQDRKT